MVKQNCIKEKVKHLSDMNMSKETEHKSKGPLKCFNSGIPP